MKKLLSTIGIIILAIFMLCQVMYAISDKPKEDAIKITKDLLNENIEQMTSD